jgi:hypothetical protein
VPISKEQEWMVMLDELKQYIASNDQFPRSYSKEPEITKLERWVSIQKLSYKRKTDLMLNKTIRMHWESFMDCYPLVFHAKEQQWMASLGKLEEYIASKHQLPPSNSKDAAEKQLSSWVNKQKQKFKMQTEIMKSRKIMMRWEAFVKLHQSLFLTNEQQWIVTLDHLKQYMTSNDQIPSSYSKDPTVKQLASWVYKQKQNYKKQTEIMKSLTLRLKWETMTKLYPQLFITKEQQWMATLDKLKQYIASEQRLPSLGSKDGIVKKLGNWVSKQKTNYRFEMETMKIQAIRTQWETMMSQHSKLFLTSSQQWMVTFVNLQRYIAATNHLPPSSSKDPKVKQLASWVSKQKQNYKNQTEIMKNQNIVALWEDFLNRYPQLFLTSEQQWMVTLANLRQYVASNDQLPQWSSRAATVKKLAYWVSNQKLQYKMRTYIMKDETISKEWEAFVEENPKLFGTIKSPWVATLDSVQQYIESNDHLPSISNDSTVSQKNPNNTQIRIGPLF